MKEIMDKLSSLKLNFCSVKDKIKRIRRRATEWEKVFAEDTSDKRLLPKIHNELLKLKNKKKKTLIKKWAKDLKRHLTRGDTRWQVSI